MIGMNWYDWYNWYQWYKLAVSTEIYFQSCLNKPWTPSLSIIFSSRCPKSFLKAPHLRAHLQTHMGAKLYACEICDKRYASAFSLKTHRVNTHGVGGVKPKCPHCSRTFCNNTFLRRHILESHEKDSRR